MRWGVWTLQTDEGIAAEAVIIALDDVAAMRPSLNLHLIVGLHGVTFVLNSACIRVRALPPTRHVDRALSVIAALIANSARQLVSDDPREVSCPRFASQPHVRGQRWPLPVALTLHLLLRLWRALFRHEVWRVGIVHRRVEDVIEEGALSGVEWLALDIPKSAIAADPFLMPVGDGKTIAFELMDYADRPGRLVSVASDGAIVPFAGELQQRTHLSYPFMLTDSQHVYCVPETAERNEVALYELGENGEWRRAAVLLTGFPALDATIIKRDGLWWLFCGKSGDTGLEDLHIFFSRELTGDWQPHPANPVLTDASAARPAGPIVEMGGHLVRFGQDCRRSYGEAVAVKRIVRLDTKSYRETAAGLIAPEAGGPYPEGVHTVCPGKGMVVVDGKTRTFVSAEFRRVVRQGLSRLPGLAFLKRS